MGQVVTGAIEHAGCHGMFLFVMLFRIGELVVRQAIQGRFMLDTGKYLEDTIQTIAKTLGAFGHVSTPCQNFGFFEGFQKFANTPQFLNDSYGEGAGVAVLHGVAHVLPLVAALRPGVAYVSKHSSCQWFFALCSLFSARTFSPVESLPAPQIAKCRPGKHLSPIVNFPGMPVFFTLHFPLANRPRKV
jgi:hypothetical protein